MSYILDALQRAEAERARGGVPTLHTRPLAGSATPPESLFPRRLRLALGGLALTVIAAVLAWWLWASASPPPSAAPAVASVNTAVPPVSTAPAAAPTAAMAPAPIAPATPAPAVQTPAAPTSPAAQMPAQSPSVAAPPAPSAAPAPQPTALPRLAETPPPKLQPSSPPAAPAVVSTPAPLLSALPEEIRRQIPPLSISGMVYSADPSQRLLLVNGLVLNEGSQVAPELSLVEIRSNSAEFNFRGTRFRIVR